MAYTGGDISGTFIGQATNNVQDFFNVRAEHGPSVGDMTHSFIADVVYTLPAFVSRSGFSRQVLGGWQVSGIIKANTGLPFDVTQTSSVIARPDVVSFNDAMGKTCCDRGNATLQYLNPAAFQRVAVSSVSSATVRPGNLRHNTFRGPGFAVVDSSISKRLVLSEKISFELRADLLNALNHTNYTTVQTDRKSVV